MLTKVPQKNGRCFGRKERSAFFFRLITTPLQINNTRPDMTITNEDASNTKPIAKNIPEFPDIREDAEFSAGFCDDDC